MSANHGRFVYWELRTPDSAAAIAFYRALFGWSLDDAGRGRVGDRPVVGVTRGDDPEWICHAAIGDLEMAAALVEAQGGAVLEADVVDGVGARQVLRDRAGARFALVELDTPLDGADEQDDQDEGFVAALGGREWTVLVTPDPDEGFLFYLPMFGWTAEQLDAAELGPYLLCRRGGREAAGVIGTPPNATAPTFWLACVRVEDVDAAAGRAAALGADVRVAPTTVPSIGRYAAIHDPTGARFGLLEVER